VQIHYALVSEVSFSLLLPISIKITNGRRYSEIIDN
jgi:hypothetical protein